MPSLKDTRNGVEQSILAELQARMPEDAPRREKTRIAASLLFFEHGIYPSAKVVLSYTQQGSLTDINRDLQSFWQELRDKARVQIDAPYLPPELVSGFGEGLAKLWELAVKKAQDELEGLRQEAQEVAAIAQREAVEAERMRKVAVDDAQAMAQELREERERREMAEKRTEAQSSEIEALRSSLAKWQQQAESEAKARQEAERQFSRDLEAERNDRQREADRFGGEIKFAKMQIETARTAERELREQLKALSESKDVELSSYRQRANRAEEALGAVRLELAEMRGRAMAAESRQEGMQERPKVVSPRPVKRGPVKQVIKRRSLR